jgi:hypothetical protein
MKKIAIVTLDDKNIIDLVERHSIIYSDDKFEFNNLIYDDLKKIDLDQYDGMILVRFDRRFYLLNSGETHPILKTLKEKKYQGKLILSVDVNNFVDKTCIKEDALFVHDFYWHDMDKIKEYVSPVIKK